MAGRNGMSGPAFHRAAEPEVWEPNTAMRRVRAEKPKRRFGLLGRLAWLGSGALIGLLAGAALFSPAPGTRMVAGGPAAAPPAASAPATAPTPALPGRDADVSAIRAEATAEATRLATLREARLRAEAELEALRQQDAELRRRAAPGRKTDVPTDATGADVAMPRAVESAAPRTLPVPATAEPARAAARVFVHHRAGSATAGQVAEEAAQEIRAAGYEVGGVRQVPFAPSARVVRYFHDEDAAAAARLAARLGPGWAIQDFRAFLPQPAPQTLEVWLPAN